MCPLVVPRVMPMIDAAKRGGETMSEAAARKERAEATLKEIELAEKLKQVITTDDVEFRLSPIRTFITSQLSNIPKMVDQKFTGKETREERLKQLTDYTDNIRKAIADLTVKELDKIEKKKNKRKRRRGK